MSNPVKTAVNKSLANDRAPRFRRFEDVVAHLSIIQGNQSRIQRLKTVYDTHLELLKKNLEESVAEIDQIMSKNPEAGIEHLQYTKVYKNTQENLIKLENAILGEYRQLVSIPDNRPLSGSKRNRGNRYGDNVTFVLEAWWDNHLSNPYPSEQEKEFLAEQCNITKRQVSTWFANKRARDPATRQNEDHGLPHSQTSDINTPPMSSGNYDPDDLFKDIDVDLGEPGNLLNFNLDTWAQPPESLLPNLTDDDFSWLDKIPQ